MKLGKILKNSFLVAQADKTRHAVNTKSVFFKILLNVIKLLLAANFNFLTFSHVNRGFKYKNQEI